MKRIISIVLCFLMVFAMCPLLFAASTITWTGSDGDGSWHNADNWDPAQVPVDGDYVTIPGSSVVEYVYGETSVRLSCAGNLTVSGGSLKLASGNSILTNGKLDGAGDLTITTGGNFSWSGGSIEGSGRLIIENNANLYAAPSSLDRYLVNNGALLIYDSLKLTCGAEGSGNFSLQQDNTLELGGNGSYNLSSSNISNMGTLRISNTCTSVNFNSGYTQQNTGTLEFDIGGLSDLTKLEVAGTASLNGILKINILDGYNPSTGDTFEIMTYGSRTGTFSSITSNLEGIIFVPTYTDTGLTLKATTVWEVANATELEAALNGFQSDDTIKLTADFTYYKGIVIDGENVTFDTGSFTLNVYNEYSSADPASGVGLEVKNGGNVYLIGSGQLYIRQIEGNTAYGVKVTDASTAMVTNVQVTVYEDDAGVGAYADGTGSSIHVLGNVHVMGVGGCGAKTMGRGSITVEGTITATIYINIGSTYKGISSGVDDSSKPGYLKYCTDPVTGIVWVKAASAPPDVPQNFTATPGNGQMALNWTAPVSDGGAAISGYEVSSDNGSTWVTTSTSTSHTFTGLTNGTEYTFKVRAVNSAGNGAEASAAATPTVPAPTQPGQLYTWGNNVHGQLGDGTIGIAQNKSIPTHIGTAEDWTTVSAGSQHTVALKSDGSLWAWGDNHEGRLGDGTSELRKDSPVRIGSDNDWVAVEAGDNHTVALKTDGSLWAWGGNNIGQLGDGTAGTDENKNVPTLIDDGSTWIAVSAGFHHTVALQADGSLWAWGDNSKGQFGCSDISYSKIPIQISTEEWAAISTGTKYTVALKADGSLWTWGWNNVGQLGDGTTEDKHVPTRVGSDTWLAAAAGENHVVAIKTDGSLWAWGGNEYGELGNGSSDGVSEPPPHPVPAQIGTATDWTSVSTGYAHNAVFKTDGSLWLWGLNSSGQLGDNTTISKLTPQRLDGAGTWLAVACGGSHTVATLEAGLTVPTAPQTFTATPGDTQVALSWTAPVSDGGAAITGYEVSSDNGSTWVTASTSTSYTFTELTNGMEYTFKVRAINSVGNGAEASAVTTPGVYVCKIGETEYEILDDALATLVDNTPTTITLLQDITDIDGISLSKKKLTINLNGKTLTVNNSAGFGIKMNLLSELNLTGSGNFNVHASMQGLHLNQSIFTAPESVMVDIQSDNNSGIYTDTECSASLHGDVSGATGGITASSENTITVNGTVTSTGTSSGNHAVRLTHRGNTVQVGNVIVTAGSGSGLYIETGAGGTVTVGTPETPAQIIGKGSGLWVRSDAVVTVYGDVEGSVHGIKSEENSTITIHGNVKSTADSGERHGINCFANSIPAHIVVNGNVEGVNGVYIHGGQSVLNVNGNVTAGGTDPLTNVGVYASYAKLNISGHLTASNCLGAHSFESSEISVDGTITAQNYVKVKYTEKTISDTDATSTRDGYLQYSDGNNAFVWVKDGGETTAPTAPQNFTATPGDTQVALSWTPPTSDGGAAISGYEVSSDNGSTWVAASANTSHTFTGLTNGTEYTFKVRAVNSAGNGAEVSATATPTEYVCEIGAIKYTTLDDALAAVGIGETKTITLLQNIDYDQGIALDNKKITFELNGYTLNLVSSVEGVHALGVYNGGGVALSGTGALNVTGPANGCGVTVYSNSALSEVTVTNASASGPDSKAAHTSGQASLTVLGDATATGIRSYGIHAQAGSTLEVQGNVSADQEGVCVSAATARVMGNVQSSGNNLIGNPVGIGISVYNGTAEIGGNVTANRVGAMMRAGGSITLDGILTAPDYIQFADDDPITIDDYVLPTTKAGYRTYQQSSNTVWIKGEAPPAQYSITVENDGNGTASANIASAAEGSEITLTATPANGYQFKEWQVISGGVTISVNSFIMPGQNVTVKAIFEPVPTSTHTVNFYSDSSLYASKTVTSGSALGANWPNNPSKSGYSFDGWFTGSNGAGTMFSSFTIINADVALYPKWTYIGRSPSVPTYQAKVKTGSDPERAFLVTVNNNTGNASIEEDPWSTRPQGRTIVTIPSIPGTGSYSVSTSLANLSKTDVQGMLTFNTDAGSITVSSNMLTGIEDAEGNNAQITIGKGDKSNLPEEVKDAIGDRPLVQLTLSIDGKPRYWNNPEAPVTVSIPYTPTAAELAHPESIVVWYIDGSGNTIPVSNGQYDPETGTVTFTTTHFSYYAVGYNQVNFKDVVSDAWYAKAVSFIAAREITTGTGSGNFSPEAKLTRGQFIVMLMRAYAIAPDLNPQDNFADAGSAYYTSYLAAAKRMGISAGVGDNMFAPEKEITRQEIFTLLYNALKAIGQLPQNDSGKVLSDFSDAEQIDAWAKDALNLLVRAGIIGGSNGKLSPLNTTTRAEMAQVLYNLLGK